MTRLQRGAARVMGTLVLWGCPVLLAAQDDSSATRTDRAPPAIARRHVSVLRRTSAVVTSAYIGLGVGHMIIGDPHRAKRFALTQLGGATALFLGAGVGLGADCNGPSDCPGTSIVAGGLAFGGLGLYLGSRAWEFVDVIVRRPPLPKVQQPPGPPTMPRVTIAPLVRQRHAGLVVSIGW